jgi:23S rRNA pseudouridine2605 synthase
MQTNNDSGGKGNQGRPKRKRITTQYQKETGHKQIRRDGGSGPQKPHREGLYRADRPHRKDSHAPLSKQPKVPGEIRLNRFIANSGICSRREADVFIETGLITVNGKTETRLGVKVHISDDVRLNGQRINPEATTYLVMNKPKGYVTTMKDKHADNTVMDLIAGQCTQRVFPVGRLDKNSTGVLLFTNDGALTEKLTHPSYNKKKIYQVQLDKRLKKSDMEKLVQGVKLEDGPMNVDAISYINDSEKDVGVEIHSGKNRIVRRLFESLGYKVKKLDRVYFAGLTKKGLERGQWRYLTNEEINKLKSGFYQ